MEEALWRNIERFLVHAIDPKLRLFTLLLLNLRFILYINSTSHEVKRKILAHLASHLGDMACGVNLETLCMLITTLECEHCNMSLSRVRPTLCWLSPTNLPRPFSFTWAWDRQRMVEHYWLDFSNVCILLFMRNLVERWWEGEQKIHLLLFEWKVC